MCVFVGVLKEREREREREACAAPTTAAFFAESTTHAHTHTWLQTKQRKTPTSGHQTGRFWYVSPPRVNHMRDMDTATGQPSLPRLGTPYSEWSWVEPHTCSRFSLYFSAPPLALAVVPPPTTACLAAPGRDQRLRGCVARVPGRGLGALDAQKSKAK